MSLLFPEIIDPNIPLPLNEAMKPPQNPLKKLLEMVERHTGYTVGHPLKRNGYWEVETIFGRIRVSDLLKTRKGMSLH